MFKKFTAFILLASLVLTMLAGCKNNNTDDDPEAPKATVGPVFDTEEEMLETFSNPIELSFEWEGGTGDPFVMRYDGVYYLYPSTSSSGAGMVYCYSSYDLVNWKFEGPCARDLDLTSAYAPEVTYFNGNFYMYTATPGGETHRCLVSSSPTGMFKLQPEKQGRKIDGHVFIDNDGKWYFYSASSTSAVQVYEMESPTIIGDPEGDEVAKINGKWTEGPMVVYHDGIYYFTYTGNHVSNRAYRICYSTSTSAPYEFKAPSDNILLVSTTLDGDITAPGHSSTVKAPDLDGYYIVYHSKYTNKIRTGRRMNIDRIIFDGTTMDVMGPTGEDQIMPSMPDIYAYFEDESDMDIFEKASGSISNGNLKLSSGKKVISKDALEGDVYTIEATTKKIAENAKAGVIFGYKDDKNYGSAVFDTKTEKLVVTFVVDGEKTTYEKALVRSFDIPYDFSAVQSIQVEKNGDTFTFYVNDRELCKYESTLSGTKIGLVAEGGSARFGFVGASDEVGGSSNAKYYKPIGYQSGMIPANLCVEYDKVDVKYEEDDLTSYVAAVADNSLNYRVYATSEGKYTFALKYRSTETSEIEVYVKGKLVKTIELPDTKGSYVTLGETGISLEEGKNVVTLYVKSGKADLKSITMLLYGEEGMTLDFSSSDEAQLIHTDGLGWTTSGALLGTDIGKRTYGDYTWADYTFECDVKFEGNLMSGGLLVRTSNAAEVNLMEGTAMETPHSTNSSSTGANWMQGYYIYCTAREVNIQRCNYSNQTVATGQYKFTMGETYSFKIVCEGADISVYVNDQLIVSYSDPDPFLTGAVGARLAVGKVTYDNFKVTLKED